MSWYVVVHVTFVLDSNVFAYSPLNYSGIYTNFRNESFVNPQFEGLYTEGLLWSEV